MLRTKDDIANTLEVRFNRRIPRGVMVATNRAGRSYNYFRAPRSRPDLAGLGRIRLSDDLEIAGIEAASLLGDEFVVTADMERTIRACFVGAKKRAISEGIPFSLTEPDLLALYRGQKGLCALSGLWMEPRQRGSDKRLPKIPSLDRINPPVGYAVGNVRWVCFAVNVGLNKWGTEAFIELCRAVSQHAG